MRPVRRILVGAAGLGLVAAGATVPATAATRAAATGPHWAPASRATIHPGVRVDVAGASCVAGFVLTDGRRVFLAVPASCTGVTDGAFTDGCSAAQVPLMLDTVRIQGARHPGTFVYSSFVHMQLAGERSSDRCHYDSLSLIQLDPRDVPRTNPSIPTLGGPSGTSRAQPGNGAALESLVNGNAVTAQAVSTAHGGWEHAMVVDAQLDPTTVGSPVLTDNGAALGMVTYIPPQPGFGQTSSSDLYRALAALHQVRGFRHVHLATGTRRYVAPSAEPTLPAVRLR